MNTRLMTEPGLEALDVVTEMALLAHSGVCSRTPPSTSMENRCGAELPHILANHKLRFPSKDIESPELSMSLVRGLQIDSCPLVLKTFFRSLTCLFVDCFSPNSQQLFRP